MKLGIAYSLVGLAYSSNLGMLLKCKVAGNEDELELTLELRTVVRNSYSTSCPGVLSMLFWSASEKNQRCKVLYIRDRTDDR